MNNGCSRYSFSVSVIVTLSEQFTITKRKIGAKTENKVVYVSSWTFLPQAECYLQQKTVYLHRNYRKSP